MAALPKRKGKRSGSLDISVVVPVLNEEESLPHLHQKLTEALAGSGYSYEIVVVDDGSTDRSFEIMCQLQRKDPHLRVVRFRRNYGQTAAFTAGFDRARGDVVITIDADLQNDPADIPALMVKMAEGYDVVSGWRVDRQDRFLDRRLPSILANRLIGWSTGVRIHDYGCSLKAYRREVLADVRLYGDLHRFIPALASAAGARVTEIPVRHYARRYGKAKYGLSRTFKVVLDILAVRFLMSFATRPIQIFGLLGLASFLVGTAMLAYLAVVRLFLLQPIGDRPLTLLGILLTMLGVQLVTTGLLAEIVTRTWYESQGKRIYTVREELPRCED
ncbi:MAG: glycosyltransferase family 2 protein [Anaerolineaceae bacterium]|nr:glycosyltransferase family 2 protein [Anaerolineae bacterium]MDX9828773.1 glycosyltransferase family 2 protein [Anaerolineae bacterium]NLF14640.1 glycosyltransferase family 2 protein [Anaerolineaceae bacterium]